jgi:hypothetical protein
MGGSEGVVNEGNLYENMGPWSGGAFLGTWLSFFVWFLGTGGRAPYLPILFICVSICVVLLTISAKSNEENERSEETRRSQLSPQQRQREEEQEEYNTLEWFYKNKRSEMTYSQNRRMEELYNKGYR